MRPLCALALLLATYASAAVPDYQLRVNDAVLYRGGEPTASSPAKDRFGPHLDSLDLPGTPLFRTQLQYPCKDVPEGDYCIGLLMLGFGYTSFAENYPSHVQLYLNDTRLAFTTHTEPLLPEDAAEKSLYQAELRCDQPAHIRPGDILRVVYAHDWGSVTVGPVRLYGTPPGDGIVRLGAPDWGKMQSHWLVARWEPEQVEAERIRQPILLYNPGVLPRAFSLAVEAKDYLQRTLLSSREEITLAPQQRLTKTFELARGDADRVRLSLTASAAGVFPDVRLSRFHVRDRASGPRPRTCLNGQWEMCFIPGVEPGDAPPGDAKWEPVTVPATQPNTKGHVCWYRKSFQAPPYLKGDRLLLNCEQILSEAWFYLNGKLCAHELHGSQPFEVDLTAGFRPGAQNELLIACRDWLAYSPRNRERVLAGEEPIFKDSMVDVVGYEGAARIGIGGSVWLEARPAISVDDVFIVTSVRNRKLSLHYRLRNTGEADQRVALAATVLDGGEVAKVLPRATVTVPAGQTATTDLTLPWPDAKLWWPDDPHLYVLQTDLQPQSGTPDRHLERFGFRELWIDGISFILNGTRVKIRSAWAGGASGVHAASPYWEPEKRYQAIWDWQLLSKLDRDVQLTRTHNMGGVGEAVDLADETGLMIKIEDADVAQTNFTFDQTFWNNALKHEVRVVDTFKNHPSVVMWSAGNENMWGWIYQGEAAKTLGNRWQIKIAKAMREFDLMHRPIEWESDGDLMGGWEHHALHYPFELSQHPDVPNSAWWGPLDGKTVVKYSMGDIILGQKPLTVGEAFWPATLSHPYGQTILLGDDPYIGGNYWGIGWMESSRYFVNGFRDVEFALIDIYNPLSMIAPQSVILKQETRSFVGGRPVHRDLNVHNDVLRPADLTLRWSLTADTFRTGDSISLRMQPAELRRLALDFALPVVAAPTPATFTVQLFEGDVLRHTETRRWLLNPPIQVTAPAGARLSLFDPVGETAAMLRKLGIPFVAMPTLQAPEAGALIIGKNALHQPPQGPWREALTAFVQGGGKVLVFEQSESPDFLPTPLTQATGRRTTIAFCRATDHPALKGLGDDDLRWWPDDHYVSFGNFRKPTRGNWLPLIDVGAMDGIVETPLVEEYEGKGSFLLCQMALTDKAAVAPAAARLLQNLLEYLASPTCYRTPGATALLAKADSPLRKALDDSLLVYEDLTGRPEQLTAERFQVAIVDIATGLDGAAVETLGKFASAGGHVMLHRARPEDQAVLEGLLGTRLRFFPIQQQPNDVRYHVFRRANIGPMAGISNHELFWVSNRLFADLRHEGGWWSYYETPKEEWVADAFCAPAEDVGTGLVPSASPDRPDATRRVPMAPATLTRPGALVYVPSGQGYFLLNQLRIEEPIADCVVTVARLRSLLLTNLGCTLRSEGAALRARQQRLQQQEFFTVDLSAYANRGLRDDRAAGLIGWTNQGENDMRNLPTGRQTFAGVPFFIASPKGAVVLYSSNANNTDLPKQLTGIKIGRKADELFFLHTAGWCNDIPFTYRVNYEDGTSVEIPIVAGRNVIDWWDDPTRHAEAMQRHGLFVAWQGENPMHKVLLPGYEWVNPNPDKVIRDIDFLSNPDNPGVVPVLVAITGAVSRPLEGVVTDIIGTQGVKVKLGTQVQDIYYIGVGGIPADHPYRDAALAAHRAMVVGQRVTIQKDVVTEDAEGHSLAYVYLGRDQSNIRDLVNARVIGEGLAKLGSFAGNDRHRLYLENLAFITQQRKVGMWSAR